MPDLVRFVFDPRVATGAKLLALFALVYLVFPVDAIPDIVPIIGWLDDVGLTAVAFLLLARAWKRHRALEGETGEADEVIDTTGTETPSGDC